MEVDLRRVVDALPGLVWTALPDGYIDFLNLRWSEYTGLDAEAAFGQGWQTVVHPEDLPDLLRRWQSVLASGRPHEMQARLRRFDGEYRLFLVHPIPMTNTDGKLVKWCGMSVDISDRRQSEDALQEQWWLWSAGRQQHFRSTTASLRGPVVLVSPTGNLEHANCHVLDYFGATLEQILGWTTADYVHPDDRPAALAAWTKASLTGHPYEVECRHRRDDGVYRWFNVRGMPLLDAVERVVYWYLTLTDVDDRRQAEALLAGEKCLLEMVATGSSLDEVLGALCRLAEATVPKCFCSVLLVESKGALLTLGAAPNLPDGFVTSIVGRPVNVDSGPCAMAACLNEQVITADLETETRWHSDAWCRLALEQGIHACWATPIVSTVGRVLGVFAMCHSEPKTPSQEQGALIDRFAHVASIAIERAQNETALRRSEAFLTEVQRLTSTGGFAWHLSSDELMWSEEVYRIFELDPALAPTLELTLTRLHPEDVPAFQAMRLRHLADGHDFEFDYRLLMPDQSVKYLHIVCRASRDHDGRPVYNSAVQDVTARRLSDEALAKARTELARVARAMTLGALTASIAHEVNQPLSGIVTNASTCLRMLGTDPPNLDGARETARRTIRDGNRASEVISRLRALFSKTDAQAEAVDLNEATREVIALLSSELQRNRVILRPELTDDLPPVTGDRIQLQQVILNLLLNASDAMNGVDDRPRQIVIRTEHEKGDRVRLDVQDTGVGIEPQTADKLFEAFYTTKTGGMGIGLSVSRSIIESHHGRLWAAANDGPGVTFSFSLPRQPVGVSGAILSSQPGC